jgi:DNA ligase 1
VSFVSPMLLGRVDQPFNDVNYIAELKLDGIRGVYSSLGDRPRLFTRHQNDITSKYPELISLDLPRGVVLDGELVVCDGEGKPDFEACMQRFSSRRSTRLKHTTFCVFDVLYYDHQPMFKLPLTERKSLLDGLFEDNDLISKVRIIDGEHASQLYDLCCAKELEGIVLKRKDSRYYTGKRSADWLKVINYSYADVWVTGVTDDRKWLLTFDQNGAPDGKPAGTCEFAPPLAKKNVYRRLEYGQPVKVRVKYRNLTKAGYLRTPAFDTFI